MIYQESLIKEIYINLMLSISVFLNLLIYFRIQVKQGSKLIRLYYTHTLISIPELPKKSNFAIQ